MTTGHTAAPDFRALFEASPGLKLVLSPAFTIVGASDTYLRATLTRREDIVGRALFEVFPETANLRDSLERVLRNGASDTMPLIRSDAVHPAAAGGGLEERYWSPTNSPIFDSEKRVAYIIHRVEDVTELVHLRHSGEADQRSEAEGNGAARMEGAVFRRAQQIQEANKRLRATNEQLATTAETELRALFDFMPQLGWTAHPDGFIDFYNRRWYEYTGGTSEQMQGWGWKTVHDPQLLPLVMEHWQESLRSGTPFEMEFPLRRHDGVFRWFLTRVTPIRNAEGNIVRWIGINTDIHDQRQAAQAGADLHAAILRNMAEGVCLVRVSDKSIVYTNPKFDLMLGYENGELTGQPVAMIIDHQSEEAQRRVAGIFAELGRSGEATYEVQTVRKDGRLVWCRAHASRLEHPSFGEVWVGVHEDITERKATEEERDGFFEMSLDLLGIGGLDGRFKRLNPAWEQVLGWTREELMSKGWLDFVHPDDLQETVDVVARAREGVPIISFENRYRCKDGSYRWLQWKAIPVLERGIIYTSARDITDGKVAKKALQELSESLATTLQSIGDGVIATDVNGMVTRMNPVAEKLTGWTQAETKGQPFAGLFTFIGEDTRSAVESPVQRSLREGRVVALPKRSLLVRRDGSEVAIGDSCAPIRTADGTVSGAVLVVRDLTGEREGAAKQAKYQQQLVFADRMASVGTLAAGVAHEINNPLTYVTANIDTVIEEIRLLGGGSISGRMKDIEEILLEAREGASRVAKIVRGLKTFSRIDEERLGVVDLVPMLELSINMSFNEIRHRARLVKNFGKIPLVDGDDARLSQVFINLFVNAAQALPEGHTEANEIRVVTSTDSSGRAVVEVEDTGPGIPDADLARVFDPFFTTKPVGVGTGLGLAICHSIITGMGGEISVRSQIGRGTTFRIVLPASSSSLPVVPEPSTEPEPRSFPPVAVLVVDDEPGVGVAVRRVLRNDVVTVVSTAQGALALLAAGSNFDLILSDLMMPGMSGIELYAELVRLHPKMVSRVVFVTGGAFTPEANAFMDRVANERVEKPFDSRQLRELVRKFAR